ncbi:MAG: hypothetical protein AB7F88_17955 [Pyrinomonadaceae bacterium]
MPESNSPPVTIDSFTSGGADDERRRMLRHFLAALAYRTQKALRGCDAGFPDFSAGNKTRTPAELVRHMASVLGYAGTFFTGGTYWPAPLPTFDEEIARFHAMLQSLSQHLSEGRPYLNGMTDERMLHGPLSDAMSHAGQLAMLRRIYGDPVPPENFIFADVSADNLSSDQAEPAQPDDVWPDAL